jgi:hypothetical protein
MLVLRGRSGQRRRPLFTGGNRRRSQQADPGPDAAAIGDAPPRVSATSTMQTGDEARRCHIASPSAMALGVRDSCPNHRRGPLGLLPNGPRGGRRSATQLAVHRALGGGGLPAVMVIGTGSHVETSTSPGVRRCGCPVRGVIRILLVLMGLWLLVWVFPGRVHSFPTGALNPAALRSAGHSSGYVGWRSRFGARRCFSGVR